MQQFNEHLYKDQKNNVESLFHFIRKIVSNWMNENSEPVDKKITKSMNVYRVSLNSSIDHQRKDSKTPSAILKKCEGARGILYMKEANGLTLHSHNVLKRTRIIEVKDVSMKIRVHEHEIANQLVYIEDILGFLKEVD